MLKIKDDVDLKELEKFGFKQRNNYYEIFNHYDVDVITIYENDKTIECGDVTADDKLYDLIQSGLVEKV